jgi:hypothetical protein
MIRPFAAAVVFLTGSLVAAPSPWEEYFEFEKIPMPQGVDPQIGGLDFLTDGRLAAVFHRGEAMIFDPKSKEWSLFANGLQEPLGVVAEEDGSLVVMQRAELTRLRDVDGDGRADRYETLSADFGLTGNYHEFAFGPARGADGHYYIALNVASNGASMRREIRGEFSEIGELNREQMTEGQDWGKSAGKAGRMYSRVPWRGWVLRVAPDGSKTEPWASGFRSPDGIGFDAKGRLLITDNQGDWRPTSPLYSVKQGGFHGHPASLVWEAGWDGRDPLRIPVTELAKRHHLPAGFFPQGELANSPTQPIVAAEGSVPESIVGQTLIGEMNQPTLVRVLDDEVGGVHQTGLVHFLDRSPLGNGNHRLAYGPDGSLYVGKTALSWAGNNGITRVKWKGTAMPLVASIKALPNGFEIGFSEPMDGASLGGVVIKRHTYHYHAGYGSPKVGEEAVKVNGAELREPTRLVVDCGPLKEGFLHLVDLSAVKTAGGKGLLGGKVWYHVVKAPVVK